MRAPRAAIWSLIVVAALVVAAVAIVSAMDFGAYKSYAEEAVQKATGRKFVIDGPVKLKLLPAPSLVAEKVRFANAPWGSRSEMATVDRVEARVALFPLVSGKVVVKRLVLDTPDILIEIDKAGRGNWLMGAAQSAPQPTPSTFAIPVLDNVTVMNGRVTWRDGQTGVSDTITIGKLTIKGAGTGAALDVALAARVRDQGFALSGRVARSDAGSWTVSNLQASAGKTRFAGSVTVRPESAPPYLTAKLESPEINLSSYTSDMRANAPAKESDGRMIPDAALPLALLRTLDADISLATKRIVSGKLVIEDAVIGVALKGGKLTIRPLAGSLAGGAIDGTATLDSAGVMEVQLTAKSIDTDRLLTALGTPDALASKAALAVRLSGHGRSLREVMASFDGTFGIVLGKGMMGSRYINLLGADLVRTLLRGGNNGNTTRLNCFAAPFVVTKGIAKTDAILFDTDHMTVHGGGTVNLHDETLDFLLKPEPKDKALFSLATPIRIRGTLASPTVYPDPAGVAKEVAGAAAGFALGPIGLLLPLVSGGTAEQNPCLAALLKRQGKAATATPKDKGSTGVLEDLGTGIEKGIRGLFGR
ncbi:MAG: AsmA family protein [Gammaproteobacteria bacterium]|nr:AsmA family protein [Gammaproteobacteria bacterium]